MIERLTNRTDGGIAYTKIPANESNMVGVGECYTGRIIDRIAAYEDTGLTPEQIQQQEMRIEYLLERGEGQEGRIKALEYLLWGTIPILEVANEHELITKINNLLEDAEQE